MLILKIWAKENKTASMKAGLSGMKAENAKVKQNNVERKKAILQSNASPNIVIKTAMAVAAKM